jgi:hypothetical protein
MRRKEREAMQFLHCRSGTGEQTALAATGDAPVALEVSI